MLWPLLQTRIIHNQPYDESLEVSDGEEITSTNATPRDHIEQGLITFSKKCSII